MERELRLSIFERELERLLASGVERDYVLFSDVRQPARYVLFMRIDGALRGEVGSNRASVETALGCLGFVRGTRAYSRHPLPPGARKLACLTELLFGAAYGSVDGLSIVAVSRPAREESFQPALELDA